MSTKLQRMINKAVREALKGNSITANQAAVDELTASGESNHERQAGRSTGSGFSKLMDQVRAKDRETVLRQATEYVMHNPSQTTDSLKDNIVRIYGIGGDDLNEVIAEGRK